MLMIALSAFGLLALYAARSDYKLAEKSAQWTQKYYQLDAEASKEAQRLNELVSGFAAGNGAFTEAERGAVASLGWDIQAADPLTVTKTVSEDAMHVEITLALRRPGQSGAAPNAPCCTVLGWREVQDEFDYSGGLNVWTGEEQQK